MWIAHLSDPHLHPRTASYRGVMDANAALAAAVRQINALVPQPDLVVLTGDVADEGAPAEYAVPREILSDLGARLLVIPGNHDERDAFRAGFADHVHLPPEGPLNFVDAEAGPIRVVALDVTVPGHHHGEVGRSSMDWLEAVLASDPGRPTIVLMHQPPLSCGVPYLDAYRCLNADGLERLLSRYPAVERVLCGHVHRQMQVRFGGTLLCTAPSTATAVALRPYPDAEPASFIEPPGFLLHHWRSGSMLTHSVPIGPFAGPFPFA